MEDRTFLHAIRSQLTVIKTVLSFVLEGQTGKINRKTRQFLEEAYKRNEKLIELTMKGKEETYGENPSR